MRSTFVAAIAGLVLLGACRNNPLSETPEPVDPIIGSENFSFICDQTLGLASNATGQEYLAALETFAGRYRVEVGDTSAMMPRGMGTGQGGREGFVTIRVRPDFYRGALGDENGFFTDAFQIIGWPEGPSGGWVNVRILEPGDLAPGGSPLDIPAQGNVPSSAAFSEALECDISGLPYIGAGPHLVERPTGNTVHRMYLVPVGPWTLFGEWGFESEGSDGITGHTTVLLTKLR